MHKYRVILGPLGAAEVIIEASHFATGWNGDLVFYNKGEHTYADPAPLCAFNAREWSEVHRLPANHIAQEQPADG